MQKKKFAVDVIWSVAALCVMNGVLQLIIYPSLNRSMGEAQFGNVLYVLGILAVFAPTVGLAANNIYLVERRTRDVKNGDLLLSMLPQVAVCCMVFLALCRGSLTGAGDCVAAAALLLMTTLRYFGDVEYRMTLNYRGYLAYYSVISLGYLTGLLLYPVTHSWLLTMLLGEAAAWVLLLVRGHVYRPIEKTEHFREVNRKVLALACSYLLYNAVVNLDRVLLQYLIDSTTVTVYYVASLLGKTTALLVGPLNGVLIGHLTQKGSAALSRKRYAAIAGCFLIVGMALYGAMTLVMPVFVHLLYPNIASEVLDIAWLANLSQIICFSSSLLLTIMLTFASTRWQLLIQSIYAIVFLALSLVMVRSGGVHGFVQASLIANAIRFCVTAAAGIILVRAPKDEQPQSGRRHTT